MEIIINENEKQYLWSKIEYRKKQNATTNKNSIYELLNSKDESLLTEDDINSIVNSLEYSIKKQMNDIDKKFRSDVASSIKSKFFDKKS